MKMTTLMSCLLVASFAATANAAAVFEITEVYAGVTGEDGTKDWIELTNTGDMAGSTGGLYYDDESADPTVDGALTALTVAPGESAVFLVKGDAADITDFENVWGTGIAVGTTADGGGLSQNGDGVFIFDGNTAGANTIDSVAFGSGFVSQQTIEFDVAGTPVLSSLGVNGAYESNPFFNDNIALPPGDTITLIGSPGTTGAAVPEPTAVLMVLAGLAGLTATRTRG